MTSYCELRQLCFYDSEMTALRKLYRYPTITWSTHSADLWSI